MGRKLPSDAFSHYLGLGPDRSYQAVAQHYGVSKQAVTKAAQRESWQERLQKVERQAREGVDRRVVETLETMNDRHLKTLRLIQRKALEALSSMPLGTAMEAVRALDISIAKERLVRGEPSDRTGIALHVVTNVDEPEA